MEIPSHDEDKSIAMTGERGGGGGGTHSLQAIIGNIGGCKHFS